MTNKNWPSRCRLLLAAAGIAIGSGAAAAQDYYGDSGSEQIIVQAPYMHRQELGREPGSLLTQERVSYSIPVSYADLDLSNPSDRTTLRDRISDAAREACHQLDRHYPLSIYIPVSSESVRDCVERAADEGIATARLVADARSSTYQDR